MKTDVSKKKAVKTPAKQAKKPAKPAAKKSAVKAKPAKTSKTPAKKPAKSAAKKTVSKNTPKKVKKQPEKHAIKVEKIEKNTEIPVEEKPVEKHETSQQQDMSLPEGSALQQTGHRRPLIVFPK
jgi:DNA-binding protein HU-beta